MARGCPTSHGRDDGHGLSSMQERAARMDGSLHVEIQPGRGDENRAARPVEAGSRTLPEQVVSIRPV